MIAEMDLDEYQKMWDTVQAVADKRRMKMKKKKKQKQRHQLARTSVDVYRLFKIRDAASALQLSTDNLVHALADQIFNDTSYMLKSYIDQQSRLAAEPLTKEANKIFTQLRTKFPRLKPKPRRRVRG